ncbi:hypothetical protein [Paraburkholderia sp. RL17-373-BIF-A]|uniref:hypothetical protein n=1 Tax=Paraburkholderia sp. RL17-373-BIF-A TaxID=3031629 RepID=UPI0038B8B869
MSKAVVVDNLYADLVSAATNPRQLESLDRIKKACDYLENQSVQVTPKAIEHYCVDRQWAGPKAQSIRNSPVLRHYVDVRRSAQDVTSSGGTKRAEPLIADETVRAYVRLLQEERDQALAARARIEAGLRLIPGVPVDELIRVGFGGGTLSSSKSPYSTALPAAAKVALEKLFDTNILANCGLQLHKDRIRQAITGNVLLEKHHVTALRELAGPSKS